MAEPQSIDFNDSQGRHAAAPPRAVGSPLPRGGAPMSLPSPDPIAGRTPFSDATARARSSAHRPNATQ